MVLALLKKDTASTGNFLELCIATRTIDCFIMTLSPWLTALVLLVVYTATAVASSSSISRRRSSSFANLHRITSSSQNIHQLKNIPRGGDSEEYDSEEYDSDEYDSEEEEEEPIVTKTKKLASSTKNVVQSKKRKEVKSKVKVALSSSATKSKSVSSRSNSGSGGIYKRYVPYIIRAVLNPFVLMRMTKSYFVSLCDINYLKEVSLYIWYLFVFLEWGRIGEWRKSIQTRSMYIYTISS